MNLDDLSAIAKLDQGKSLASIELLSTQCADAWEAVEKLNFPVNYSHAKSILITGMGGSAYGARLIKSLYSAKLPVPLDLICDYRLPGYVGPDTLVIAASYSGNTEETISAAHEAILKKAMVIGVTSGGELAEVIANANKPVFVFSPSANPSGQPRLGQGYMQVGQLAILAKLGIITVTNDDFDSVIGVLEKGEKSLNAKVTKDINPAKKLACALEDKVVNIIGAEFLEGAIHAIRNPFHETGKHFANYFLVPELNHHLMEGLSYPRFLHQTFMFLLINSGLYDRRIDKRMRLTKEVIEKNKVAVMEINLQATTKLAQNFELIQLGSYVTFYLAMLHNVNPALIPWVDYFKEQLKK